MNAQTTITTESLKAQREVLANICREINDTVKSFKDVDAKIWKRLEAKRVALIQTCGIAVPIDETEALSYFEESLRHALGQRRTQMMKQLAELTEEAEKGGYRLASALEWKTESLMKVSAELSLYEYAAKLWEDSGHTYADAVAVIARFQERMMEILLEKGRNLNNSTSVSTNLMNAITVDVTAGFISRGAEIYLRRTVDVETEKFVQANALFITKIAEAKAFLADVKTVTVK